MRPSKLILAIGCLASAGAWADTPFFKPISLPDHTYTGGWEHFVGGGVATFDCDGDLLPELYVAGGTSAAILLRNTTGKPGNPLSFRHATPSALAMTGVIGAYPLDIDSDGRMDLAILRVGENRLMRGGPDCSFAPFPETLGFSSSDRWTTAFSATWEPGQTLPTLAFGNYVDRTNPKGPFGTCDVNLLYRPSGKHYGRPRLLSPGYCALSMLFSDWGRKGRADLRISNDRHYYVKDGEEQMWAMEHPPRLYTKDDGWRSYSLWGMGIASRDITGDGLPEVFLSSMADQKLQMLAPTANGPTFADVTYDFGTTAQRPYTGDDGRPSTGWHIAFGDAQNDGLDDVFIAKGNVQEMPGLAMRDPNNLLVQQANGRFSEAGLEAGLADMERGRGAAFEDLNLDGKADIVVVNRAAPMRVYENQTVTTGNWLLLDIRQPAPNINAVGAWLEIADGARRLSREITVGGGHASGAASLQHFGLGQVKTVKLRVIWPDHTVSDWVTVKPNQMLRLMRQNNKLSVSPL